MKVRKSVYQFLFHPLAKKHSGVKKFLATISVIALSILTGGTFLVAFGIINLRDRNVTVGNKATKEARVAQKVLPQKKTTSHTTITVKPAPTKSKIDTVKQKQAEQLKQFEQWTAKNEWGKFHLAHYDWWMFPINRSSQGRGMIYAVTSSDIQQLKQDPEFMKNYRRGVELVARAWGWDVNNCTPIQNPTSDQKWQNWPVRLGKMADSLRLFDEQDLRDSMRQYSVHAELTLEYWVLEALGTITEK